MLSLMLPGLNFTIKTYFKLIFFAQFFYVAVNEWLILFEWAIKVNSANLL